MPGKYWSAIIDAAVDNGGYITPSMVDVPAIELRKMVARGTLESAAHGVYRVPELPRDRYDEFILARLWATGRGVISHDSALLVHELCDINPTAIHITIPNAYRISRAGGEKYKLHKSDLADGDITRLDAIVLTTIRRTLDDCVDLVPEYLLRQAIDTATGRGAINSNDCERLVATIGTTTVS